MTLRLPSTTTTHRIRYILLMLTGIISSVTAFTGLPLHLLHQHPSTTTTTTTALHYLRQDPTNDNVITKFVPSSPARFTSCASRQSNAILAIDELVQGLAGKHHSLDLVILFVGQYHSQHFEKICSYLQIKLGHKNKYSSNNNNNNSINVEILSILGGGVIGGGEELDQPGTPAMTLLAGKLPPASHAAVFQYQQGVDNSVEDALLASTRSPITAMKDKVMSSEERPPSYMVFSDPYAPLEELLTRLEKPSKSNPKLPPPVIAGGISVPPKRPRQRRQQQPMSSIARNGRLLSSGSLIGVEFTGNVGLLAVVAQGCRPVGPTFVITQASNTILTGLSGESAITRLEQVAAAADRRDQELIRNGELVCGIGSSSNIHHQDSHTSRGGNHHSDNGLNVPMVRIEDDFLIRQIMGFQPKSGSIVVAAGGLKEGSIFRFHVRAAKSAREDMDLMIQRAKTERLFAGSSNLFGRVAGTGKPLAALQVSCVARGRSFFGAPNVDLKKVEELFDDNAGRHPPIAGFFANGEIGPVGIRSVEMAAKDAEQADSTATKTFLHGFTTVVAMLCDYSKTPTLDTPVEMSSSAIICRDDSWA